MNIWNGRFISYLLVFSNLVCFASVFADDQAPSAKCDFWDDLCTIQRPVKRDDGQLQNLSYTFRYRQPKDGSPVVVFFPGGPGQGSSKMDLSDPGSDLGSIPRQFGYILIDPQFVGINNNSLANDFSNSISSVQVAEDAIAAIQSVGVKDYIFFGVSYGTVTATIAAAEKGIKAPRAVVLEATVGRHLDNAEYDSGYVKEWDAFVKSEKPEVFAKFQKRVRELIANQGFTPADFGDFLQFLLIERRNAQKKDLLKNYVEFIANASSDDAQSRLRQKIDSFHGVVTDNGAVFHRLIVCQELVPNGNPGAPDFYFDGTGKGELKINPNPSCYKTPITKGNLFDSAKFQIKAPIYYISGQDDPATPSWQADYHYQHQDSVSKYMISVANGSHTPLNTDLSSCAKDFWLALADGKENASATLLPCADHH